MNLSYRVRVPSDRSYREVFERSADAILIIEDGRFVDCNQATVEMLRYETKEQLLQTHPSELSPPKQPDGLPSFEKANAMIDIAVEHGSHRFEWIHIRADGDIFPVEVLLTAVRHQGRDQIHVVWRDITERKTLEEQLRQTQKMEAIGKLAGGVAHDFNNLLVAIIGHTELLRLRLSGDIELEHIAGIDEAATRATALIKRLLTFSRKQAPQSGVLDLRQTFDALGELLRRLIGEDVALHTHVDPGAMHVRIDKGQFEQIVLNLSVNARDAMPQGGALRLDLRIVELCNSPAEAVIALPPGAYVLLTAEDDGVGMDAETKRRAFEPFFTTKEVGKGTGLGLSTIYATVKASRGSLALESSPGRGCTLRVWFPLTSDPPSTETSPRQDTVRHGGSERILVAEDEPAVSAIIVHTLRQHGYDVTLARDGQEALALFIAHEGNFDLLLTDVVMPRMGGPQLIEELRAKGFEPRVLFSSGYAGDSLATIERRQDVDLLPKPFTPLQLTQRVRVALDR